MEEHNVCVTLSRLNRGGDICCYLLKETGQKLKSHYGVIPIMIVLFINRTYLKYLNAGLSH